MEKIISVTAHSCRTKCIHKNYSPRININLLDFFLLNMLCKQMYEYIFIFPYSAAVTFVLTYSIVRKGGLVLHTVEGD
jgi:hypothetical protein